MLLHCRQWPSLSFAWRESSCFVRIFLTAVMCLNEIFNFLQQRDAPRKEIVDFSSHGSHFRSGINFLYVGTIASIHKDEWWYFFFFSLPSLNWTLTYMICNAFALNFEKASRTFTPTRSNSYLTSLMRLNFGSRWTEMAIVNLNQPGCSSHLGQPTKTAVGWFWFICRTS